VLENFVPANIVALVDQKVQGPLERSRLMSQEFIHRKKVHSIGLVGCADIHGDLPCAGIGVLISQAVCAKKINRPGETFLMHVPTIVMQ
jgi:hypothetical protein